MGIFIEVSRAAIPRVCLASLTPLSPISGPPGVLSIVIVAIFLPASKVDSNTTFAMRLRAKFARETVQRVDVLGAFSLLAASMLLVFALEEGGSRYPWDSGAIISTLVLSGVLWVFFVAWEIYLEKTRAVQEPIFPMGLLKNRLISSMMLYETPPDLPLALRSL